MITLIVTILRTTILYIFVTLAIRLMGKRQIGEMQPNELVVTLLISEIAAIPLQDSSQPVINGVVAIFVLVIFEIVISWAALKSFSLRKFMSGSSMVIIKNGELDQKTMRRVRMTVLDLIELLRAKEVYDIDQVAYAVLEVNGELSVLLKGQYRTATAADVGVKPEEDGLPLPVISDGKLVKDSFDALKIGEAEVLQQLEARHLRPDEVFLMTLDRYGNHHIILKETK